jgi:putative metalloprotease
MYKFSAWRTARTLDQQSVTLMDPALSPLLQRMAKALDLPKLSVQIYEIDPINGLAAPDGRIFITRGFYNKYKAGDVSGEELASVIAHELGHVALGHARRRMIDFSGQNAVRAALGMVLGRVIPWIGPWIAGLVTNLLMARLSRGDEYEADEYAAALMVKSGLGTEAQKTLFLKLEELTGQIGSLPAWLMSHPKTSDRITAIEALEKKWGIG